MACKGCWARMRLIRTGTVLFREKKARPANRWTETIVTQQPDHLHMLVDSIRDNFNADQAAIDSGPIYPDVTAAEIRAHLASRYDFSKGQSLDEVTADVERMLRYWHVQITHPRYFGLFNPSVTLASVVADTLVATYNPQLASWRTSPAGNEIERHTLSWLAGKFGFSADAIATFTTGGAEANLSAVIAALTRAFPEYGDDGLRSLDASPVIYLSDQAHHSFTKIAHVTGLGRNAIRAIATGSDLRMDPDKLKDQIQSDRKNGLVPLMVIGTAGTTTAGVIDPLADLAQICRDESIWFHVDAAWGGAAILAPSLRHHLDGIELADSITCDAHKWFSVAMGCGMFFCRHPDAICRAFRADAAYMPSRLDSAVYDPYTTSLQWSRRFTGLKLFMSLAELGEDGQAKLIESQAAMGDLLRETLTRSGWTVVNHTPLPLVCFTRDGLDVPSFLAALHEKQVVWMSEAHIKGDSYVRGCITSFKTTRSDILDIVGQMTRIALQPAIGS
jgi:glutamate/tyrosine decarboxylase-like PLP-dependent enzyme